MPGAILKHYNWLEDVLIPVTSAVARVAWLSPLVHVLLNNILVLPRGTLYPAWLILGLLLGASALSHALAEQLGARVRVTVAGMLIVFLIVGYTMRLDRTPLTPWQVVLQLTDFSQGVPAPFLVALITAALWRYGLASSWNYFGELWRSFLVGVVVLGLLLLLPSAAVPGLDEGDLWNAMVLFVFSGLMALALLAVADTLASEGAQGGAKPTLNRYWLVAVGTVVLVVLLMGLLLGQILSPQSVKAMLRVFTPIVALLGRMLYLLILAMVYAMFWMLGPLINWMRGRTRQAQPENLEMQRRLVEQWQELERVALEPSVAVQNVLRIVLVALLFFGILAAFFFAWRRHRRRQTENAFEEREFIWSKDLLLGQLRGLLSRKSPKPKVLPYLILAQPDDPRQAVRLLYQRLLAVASALGRPRPRGLTPSAYARLLAGLAPGELPALHALTDAYLVARYAPNPPTAEQVSEARQAYTRLEATLASPQSKTGQ